MHACAKTQTPVNICRAGISTGYFTWVNTIKSFHWSFWNGLGTATEVRKPSLIRFVTQWLYKLEGGFIWTCQCLKNLCVHACMHTYAYIILHTYIGTNCDGFAQSITRQQLSKHVPTHAPCNNTVEVFSPWLVMDLCYTTHARWRQITVCRDHVTRVFYDTQWRHTTVAVTWRVSCEACPCRSYTRFQE
jgi:hypothetical protein